MLVAVKAKPCSPCSPYSALRASVRLRVAARGARFARSLDSSSARRGRAGAPARSARVAFKESMMLRIYGVLLQLVREVRPRIRELERCDADLARQCRRALCSVPLNLGEGA